MTSEPNVTLATVTLPWRLTASASASLAAIAMVRNGVTVARLTFHAMAVRPQSEPSITHGSSSLGAVSNLEPAGRPCRLL